MRLKKIIEAADAVAVIHAGDTVASAGYAGSGTPDQLFVSIEQRFLETGTPRDLTLVFAAGQGDGQTRVFCFGIGNDVNTHLLDKIAEKTATLDILSGGRLHVGTGRSATWTELGGFRANPDTTKKNGVLVMCEVMMPDGKTPHPSNSRANIPDDPGAWFGFEQEYFLYKDGAPLGFPPGGVQHDHLEGLAVGGGRRDSLRSR